MCDELTQLPLLIVELQGCAECGTGSGKFLCPVDRTQATNRDNTDGILTSVELLAQQVVAFAGWLVMTEAVWGFGPGIGYTGRAINNILCVSQIAFAIRQPAKRICRAFAIDRVNCVVRE